MYRCPECDYGYVETLASDRRLHRTIHDKVMFGVKIGALSDTRTAWQHHQRAIVVINADSPLADRRVAQEVSLIAAGETDFSFVAYHANEQRDERNLHMFIGVENQRAKSYVAFELRPNVWSCTWEEYAARIFHRVPERAPMWSIGYMSVCRSSRRQGWIRRTLDAARIHLKIKGDDFGWHTPFSDDGLATARRICPHGINIAR
jgi:hypothetical protein